MQYYLIAPSGTPIAFGELIRTLYDRFKKRSRRESLEKKVQKLTGAKHCFFLNSGRSAMALTLVAMRATANGGRDEVILPAYSCYSVAAATVRAGLRIRLVDVDPATLDFDYASLEETKSSRVLAAVGCNLFGIVNDWDRLRDIALAKNYLLIDDGAQSMGARYKGKSSGSMGEAGFFSLGRGKALTTYNGGILVTSNDRLAAQIEQTMTGLGDSRVVDEAAIYVKLVLYSIFIRPRLYWIPASLPFLGLGETVYDVDFPIDQLSTIQVVAGSIVVDRILDFQTARAENAIEVSNLVRAGGKFMAPTASNQSSLMTPFLRLPVMAPDQRTRDKAIAELRKRGIVASKMYPTSLKEIPGIEPHLCQPDQSYPGAQKLVETLFTLPTHPFLTERDFETMRLALDAV